MVRGFGISVPLSVRRSGFHGFDTPAQIFFDGSSRYADAVKKSRNFMYVQSFSKITLEILAAIPISDRSVQP
jgi:hypothetical protein